MCMEETLPLSASISDFWCTQHLNPWNKESEYVYIYIYIYIYIYSLKLTLVLHAYLTVTCQSLYGIGQSILEFLLIMGLGCTTHLKAWKWWKFLHLITKSLKKSNKRVNEKVMWAVWTHYEVEGWNCWVHNWFIFVYSIWCSDSWIMSARQANLTSYQLRGICVFIFIFLFFI